MISAPEHLDLAGKFPLIPERLQVGEALSRITALHPPVRQERLSGIHNPWGIAIGFTDPWAFLELCEGAAVKSVAVAVVGPDVILWDSELFLRAATYASFLQGRNETRYWPIEPLAGGVVLVSFKDDEIDQIHGISLGDLNAEALANFDPDSPLYVIRVMSGSSHFNRDPGHPANRACMVERVLINYAIRPLWLLSGSDSAANDLVTGFAPAVPVWAGGAKTLTKGE